MLARLCLYREDSAEPVWANHADLACRRRKLIVVLEFGRLYVGMFSKKIGCQSGTLGFQSGSRNARDNYGQDDQDHHHRQELGQHETTFTGHFSNSLEFRLLANTQRTSRNHVDFLCPPTQSIENRFLVAKCGEKQLVTGETA